ncbi:MAG: cell division protein FtsI [Microbacterium sp. 67-17]|uniref:peptidoglycan D,D-transpeptidase FtsI family protein n=1 Tax=Microbacterium sp. 67-17 TaxID=1895782 RepID=UPI0009650D73|nr:penicillin-binding protein 2 [Microbacterium sp. 67-17]OJW01395.1 MAG: cell division protein FtsI [Microbacterium sp. 67-17]
MTGRSTRSPRRRTVVAMFVVLAVIGAFVIRLVDIQVVNANDHIEQSLELGLSGSQKTYGTRGTIVDENGATLAGSIVLYDAQLDPKLVGAIDREIDGEQVKVPWETISAEIGAVTGQTAEEIQAIVAAALAENPESRYAMLTRGLTTAQYRELADMKIPYLAFVAHPARTYPDGAVAGNLVGFVGSDGTPLAGLEVSQDGCLASTDGEVSYQRGGDGVIIPGTMTEKPAVDGGTLQLTINRDLNWYLQQLIAEQTQNTGAKAGSIFVVEVKTGAIRAAAEYPTVDPNAPTAVDESDRASRIFRNTFEPGSTFKALSAAMLVDSGTANPFSVVHVPFRQTFDNGASVRDDLQHPDYDYTLNGVLVNSSNVGISTFAGMMSDQARYDYLTKFGIGQGTDVDFLGEANGLVRDPSQWDNQTKYNTSYGQGLTTTVPELANAYQAIANGGLKLPLRLVESCTAADGTVTAPDNGEPTQVISPEAARQVTDMLENVATKGSVSEKVGIAGYRLALKTGTAEKVDPGAGTYKVGSYFTTIAGFAPADDPQYVVVVTLDEPTTVKSSSANAPAFREAMTQVLKTYRIMPSNSASPDLPTFG